MPTPTLLIPPRGRIRGPGTGPRLVVGASPYIPFDFACGGECNNPGHWTSVTGPAAFVSSGQRTGGFALRFQATTQACYYQTDFASADPGRRSFASFYVFFNVLATGASVHELCRFMTASANEGRILFDPVDNKLKASFGAGTAGVGPVVTTGVWYLIDVVVDTSNGQSSIEWFINGTEQQAGLNVQAAHDVLGFRAGSLQGVTVDFILDDIVASQHNSWGLFPVGAHTVDTTYGWEYVTFAAPGVGYPVITDTMVRANQANFGRADYGGGWSGDAISSILSNRGRFTLGASGSGFVGLPGSYADLDVKVLLQASNVTSFDGDIRFRYDSVAVNSVEVIYNTTHLSIRQKIAGVNTSLIVGSANPITAGVDYWMRAQVIGQFVRGKIWVASGVEQSTWDVEAVTIVTAPGEFGLAAFATTAVNLDWGSLTAGYIGINDAAVDVMMPYIGGGYSLN